MSTEIKPQAVLFDLYNTLIHIETAENDPQVWHNLARFLRYQGLYVEAEAMRTSFFDLARSQKSKNPVDHPEVHLLGSFRTLLADMGYRGPDRFCIEITQLFRALSMRHFELFTDAMPCLRALRPAFKLGVISDAQRTFLEPELDLLSLTPLFDVVVVSGDHGFRKPDPRLFRMALAALSVEAEEAVFVGDHSYRDVCGAQAAGMQAVWLRRSGQEADRRSCPPDRTMQNLTELVDWLLR